MTPELIKQLALESGWPDSLVAPVIMAKLADFAALVAAHQRELDASLDVTPMHILASDGPGVVVKKYRAAIRG